VNPGNCQDRHGPHWHMPGRPIPSPPRAQLAVVVVGPAFRPVGRIADTCAAPPAAEGRR
jgi:hypothetical protein